jgi:hypothetical protein
MGADDFIRKPFSHRVLVEQIKAVLRRSGKLVTVPKEPDASKLLERGLLRMDARACARIAVEMADCAPGDAQGLFGSVGLRLLCGFPSRNA